LANAFGRQSRLFEFAPIGDDGVEIDRENAARAGRQFIIF
jgi:hypothetical protein